MNDDTKGWLATIIAFALGALFLVLFALNASAAPAQVCPEKGKVDSIVDGDIDDIVLEKGTEVCIKGGQTLVNVVADGSSTLAELLNTGQNVSHYTVLERPTPTTTTTTSIPTTTTTVATTTTSQPATTTTTTRETTSTTIPKETTTTAPPATSTTTTVPSTTTAPSTTTTPEPTTTTTTPPTTTTTSATTTSVAPTTTTTTSPESPGSTLPFTGMNDPLVLSGLALSLLASGGLMLAATRKD